MHRQNQRAKMLSRNDDRNRIWRMGLCIYTYFKASVNECLFHKQDNLIIFFSSHWSVSVSVHWAVACILIVQCHLVTAHIEVGRNCQGKLVARADLIGCKVRWFTTAKRLLNGRSSKMKSDPLYLEMGPLQKLLLVWKCGWRWCELYKRRMAFLHSQPQSWHLKNFQFQLAILLP